MTDEERATFVDVYRLYERFCNLKTMGDILEAAEAFERFEIKHNSPLAINLGTAVWDSLPEPSIKKG